MNSIKIIKDIPIRSEHYTIICHGDIRLRNIMEKKHDVLSGLDLRLRTYILKCREYPLLTISWSSHAYRVFVHQSNPYIVLIKGDITDNVLLGFKTMSARDNGIGRV